MEWECVYRCTQHATPTLHWWKYERANMETRISEDAKNTESMETCWEDAKVKAIIRSGINLDLNQSTEKLESNFKKIYLKSGGKLQVWAQENLVTIVNLVGIVIFGNWNTFSSYLRPKVQILITFLVLLFPSCLHAMWTDVARKCL